MVEEKAHECQCNKVADPAVQEDINNLTDRVVKLETRQKKLQGATKFLAEVVREMNATVEIMHHWIKVTDMLQVLGANDEEENE